jgi:hypothetical protein
LQKADAQLNTLPISQQLEEKSDESKEENDATQKIAFDNGPADVVETNKSSEK